MGLFLTLFPSVVRMESIDRAEFCFFTSFTLDTWTSTYNKTQILHQKHMVQTTTDHLLLPTVCWPTCRCLLYGSIQSGWLKSYRFPNRNLKSFPIEPTYAAFTVNAACANVGTLPLNFNHTVKLNFCDTDWIGSLLYSSLLYSALFCSTLLHSALLYSTLLCFSALLYYALL